jgi:hypothetical protein
VLVAVRATIAPAAATFRNWCVIVESPSHNDPRPS